MKYTYTFLLFVLYSLSAIAADMNLCIKQGKIFGRNNAIDPTCREIIKKVTHPKTFIRGEKVTLYGHQNIVFIDYKVKKKTKKYTIAGDRSLIQNVQQLSLSKDEQTLYLLDSNRVLIFSTMTNGNSSPKQVIKLPHNCFNLLIDHEKNSFAAICDYSVVITGKIEGDSRLKKKMPKFLAKKITKSVDRMRSETSFFIDNEVIFFDQKEMVLEAFQDGNVSWKMELQKEGMKAGPIKLEKDKSGLKITDKDKNTIVLN